MSSVIELVDGALLVEPSTLTVFRVVGVRADLVAFIEVQRPGALPKVRAPATPQGSPSSD